MITLKLLLTRTVLLLAVSFSGCTKRQPASVYPKPGFQFGSLAAVDPMQIPVLFNEDTPPCEYQEIATILYDWAKDGVFTSQSIVYDGLRKEAASIGAHGIYKVVISNGAHLAIGMGVGTTSKTGDATVSGSTISGSSSSLSTGIGMGTRAQEVGGQAVAYICVSEKNHK